MSEYKLVTQRIGLIGIANLIASLSGLILLPILTKNLSIEEYGIWVQIGVTIGFLVPLATLNLGLASQRFLAGETDKKVVSKGFSSILSIVFFTSLIISVLIFVFSKPISIAIFGGPDAEYFVKFLSFLILLGGINASLDMFFVTFLQIKKHSILSILRTIFQILLISYFVLSGFGLFGAVISLLILNVLMFIPKLLLIVPQIRLSFPSYSLIKKYLTFSAPMIPAILCWWMNNLGDRYVIGYFLGMASVGIYSASYNLGGLVSLFYAPIAVIILPTITKLYKNNKIQEIKTHLSYLLKAYIMLAVPSAFGLTVLSTSLLTTLTTSEFLSGAIIVPIIALATIILYCSSLNANILLLFEKTKTAGSISIVTASANIILNIILVPLIGILGAAIATLLAFTFHLFLTITFSFKMMKYDVDFKFIIKCIISSVIMAFVVWKLNPVGAVDILISIGIAVGVYFGVMVLLRGFTKEEYVFFRSIVRR